MNFAFEDDEYCDFMTDVPNVMYGTILNEILIFTTSIIADRLLFFYVRELNLHMRALEIFIQTSNPV